MDTIKHQIYTLGIQELQQPLYYTGKNKQNTIGTYCVRATLHQRNTSRINHFNEIVATNIPHISTAWDMLPLLTTLSTNVHAISTYIRCETTLFFQISTPATKHLLMQPYTVGFEASLHTHNKDTNTTGISSPTSFTPILECSLPLVSLCPCALRKSNNKYSHMQRVFVTLRLISDTNFFLEDLLQHCQKLPLTMALPLVYSNDEQTLLKELFKNPQLLEELLHVLANSLQSIDRIQGFSIRVQSFETLQLCTLYGERSHNEQYRYRLDLIQQDKKTLSSENA